MKRYRDLEKFQATVRDELPAVAVSWLEAVRVEMEKLTKAALSGEVSDDEFRKMVEQTSKRMPEMLERMNHDALATHMEKAMGAAMANGMAERQQMARQKTVVSQQSGATREEVVTFTKKNPRELKKVRQGRRIFPAG